MNKVRISAMLGLSMLALAASTTSATASEPAPTDTAAVQYCEVNVDTRQVVCDADPAEAQRRAGTEGLVKLVTLFDRKHFDAGGGYIRFWGPHACSGGYDPEYGPIDLGDYGWSNRASSVKTFNRCDVKLFDPRDCGPPSSTWIDQKGDLSLIGDGWNNRASCIKIS